MGEWPPIFLILNTERIMKSPKNHPINESILYRFQPSALQALFAEASPKAGTLHGFKIEWHF
jgi:hypothetical protein